MSGIGDTWGALADKLYGDEPDYEAEPVELPDADAVNRALGRLERVRREFAEQREVAEAEIARAQEFVAKCRDQFSRAEAYHLGQLQRYHEALLEQDSKRKTIQLPNGRLEARDGSKVWLIDDAVFIPWALTEGRDDLVRTPERPPPAVDRNAVKQALVKRDEKGRPLAYGIDPETSERIPGVTVEDGDTTFKAKTDTEVK
jgi:hypothetical protein